ncbi:MAG: DMT family transporter [Dehalococcoidia bacterium]
MAVPAVDAGAVVTSGPQDRRRLTSGGTSTDAFGITEWGLLAAIATIWGSSFFFMAVGLETLRPGVITMARLALGAMTLGLVPRARTPVERSDLWRVGVLGVVWMGVPLTLFPVAQQWIDSSVAGMINGAMPITTAAWAAVLARRVQGRRQLAGIAVGFVGVVAVFLPELRGSSATALGAGLVGLAVVLYGLAANLAVPLQQRYGALPIMLRAQLAALVVVVPMGILQLPGSRFAWQPVLAMLPLGVLGTGLAFSLMATLVGRVGGPRGSVAVYFVPIVAVVLGVLVRGEQAAPIALFGVVLVFVGVWTTSRRES